MLQGWVCTPGPCGGVQFILCVCPCQLLESSCVFLHVPVCVCVCEAYVCTQAHECCAALHIPVPGSTSLHGEPFCTVFVSLCLGRVRVSLCRMFVAWSLVPGLGQPGQGEGWGTGAQQHLMIVKRLVGREAAREMLINTDYESRPSRSCELPGPRSLTPEHHRNHPPPPPDSSPRKAAALDSERD